MFQSKLNFLCHCCPNLWYFQDLENINFFSGKSIFFKFSWKSCFCDFRAFFLPKIIPKPFQNEVRTMKKSMPKRCWFPTSIFWGFGFDLGGSWASKMEPCWLKNSKIEIRTAFFGCLKLNVFYKLRLGGLQAPFWRLQVSILEGLETIF